MHEQRRMTNYTCAAFVFALALAKSTFAFSNIPAKTTSSFGIPTRNTLTYSSHPSSKTCILAAAAMPDGPPEGNWDKNKKQPNSSTEKPSSRSSFPKIDKNNILPSDEEIGNDASMHNANGINSDFSMPPSRLKRMQREDKSKSQFLHGDELIELRKYIRNLETELQDAKEQSDTSRLADITRALYDSKKLDAEHVYQYKLSMAKSAQEQGLEDEAEEYRMEALDARNCLPQFNLSGLWVGKYGEHGYEMINVTYVEDTIIATKVTGDKNVPKNEITFTANLSPDAQEMDELEPIELSDAASKQWGHKYLPRFPGKGQVAAEGFTNNQWMEGQLILVGEYFSFAWIPIGHQIFFGRPSAELTLKMLKQSQMADYGAQDTGSPNAVAEMRAFAQRCFEETEMLSADDDAEGELCFLVDDESYFCQDGCFE